MLLSDTCHSNGRECKAYKIVVKVWQKELGNSNIKHVMINKTLHVQGNYSHIRYKVTHVEIVLYVKCVLSKFFFNNFNIKSPNITSLYSLQLPSGKLVLRDSSTQDETVSHY